MRRVLRWVRRILLGTLVLTVVLVGIALIVVHTDWGRERIRRKLESTLNDSFPGGATIGKLEGSVFGALVIRDLEIRSLDGKPAITIKTLRAELALAPLFHKTARVDTLTAEDVTMTVGDSPLTRPPDDTPVTISEPAGTASGSAWSIELVELGVHRGTLSTVTPRGPLTLDDVEIEGDLALPAGAEMRASVKVHGMWRERKLPVDLVASVQLGTSITVPLANVSVGGVKISATALSVVPGHPVGTVTIEGSAAAVAAIEPTLVLPADARITIVANGPQLELEGVFGTARLQGQVRIDRASRSASGIIGATGIDVASLTHGRSLGSGELSVAFEANRTSARGVLALHGHYGDLPAGDATVHFDAQLEHADVVVLATSVGEARVVIRSSLRWHDREVDVESARLVAAVDDVALLSDGRIALHGPVRADISVVRKGTLAPALDLKLAGRVNGKRVRFEDIGIGALDAVFGASATTAHVIANGNATITNVTSRGKAVGTARIQADYKADGRIVAQVHAVPSAAAVALDLGATVTLGDVVEIALGKHVVQPVKGATWRGAGGHVSISDRRIRVTGVTTTNGDGKLELAADVDRLGGALQANVVATQIPATIVDPSFHGSVSGTLAVKRQGVRWDGSGDFSASGLSFRPDVPALDGRIQLGLENRHVHVDAEASNPTIGRARFELAFDGPQNVIDVLAWRSLDRPAVTRATLTVDHVNLLTVSPTGGVIDGKVLIAGAETTGSVEVKNVQSPIGNVEGKVSFSPLGRDLFASWHAKVSELGEANVGVRIAFPDRPFDPAAWESLGRGAVRSLTASFDDLAIDPARLAKLGIKSSLRGHANLQLAVGSSAAEATLTVNAKGIEGGRLARPIDVHVTATTSSSGTTASACVGRTPGKGEAIGACSDEGGLAVANAPHPLLELVDVRAPVTFTQWLVATKTALAAPITGRLVIPVQDAPALFAIFGRHDFVAGKLDGSATLDGTIGNPTGSARFTARDMKLSSTIAGRMIPTLTVLQLDAKWLGTEGVITLAAEESNKGKLRASITGRPDKLSTIVAGLGAENLDLAPIAAFLPGALAAASGTLRGALKIESLDAATRTIRGDLHLREGNVPIAPIIGTLRGAEADLVMIDRGITLKAKGALGSSRIPNVILDVRLPNDLSTLDGTLTLSKVAPLAEIEPILDGTVEAKLRRADPKSWRWSGDLTVRNARVFVPPSKGDDLLDADVPDDIYDVEEPPDTKLGLANAREPVVTWLDANVIILSTPIEVEEYGVRGSIRSRDLTIAVGDTIGLRGKIVVEYGIADDIFGRQYQIEPTEAVSFDGTIDPEIDVRLVHEFPSLVLTAIIEGRLSDPEFPTLDFEANPRGKYTRDQLFAFFAGADPEGESTSQARDAATGAGASVLSGVLSKRLKKVLPKQLKLDVIKCEPGSSAASSSCTFGRWFFDQKLYVALKRRIEARPDENTEDLQGQYYLSREWILEGVGGDRNHDGVDLLWRRRW